MALLLCYLNYFGMRCINMGVVRNLRRVLVCLIILKVSTVVRDNLFGACLCLKSIGRGLGCLLLIIIILLLRQWILLRYRFRDMSAGRIARKLRRNSCLVDECFDVCVI